MRIVREDTVHQLTFYRESLSVNCYFVKENDGLTLVDAGAFADSCSEILQAASDIGKAISRIVLTHVHHDHVGALDALKEAIPDLPVYISAREARLMAGDLTLDPDEPKTPIRGIMPRNLKTRPDVLIREGDRIGSLLTLAAPGHTPGSMAFLDTRNNALIAGDALQIEGGIAVAGQLRPSFPFPARGTWNPRVALESARKLREYGPSLLAVGHGELLKDPSPEMDRAIAEAAYNLAHPDYLSL